MAFLANKFLLSDVRINLEGEQRLCQVELLLSLLLHLQVVAEEAGGGCRHLTLLCWPMRACCRHPRRARCFLVGAVLARLLLAGGGLGLVAVVLGENLFLLEQLARGGLLRRLHLLVRRQRLLLVGRLLESEPLARGSRERFS